MSFDLAVSEADDPEFVEFLHLQIRAFNTEHSPHHRAIRPPGAIKPLHVMLTDESGQTVGGLSGRIYWDWLEVENLYVPADARGQGIGTAVLQMAEATAFSRGARHVFLTTYEFQARMFYEKQGYYVVGTLEGYPPGSAYYWLRKDLI